MWICNYRVANLLYLTDERIRDISIITSSNKRHIIHLMLLKVPIHAGPCVTKQCKTVVICLLKMTNPHANHICINRNEAIAVINDDYLIKLQQQTRRLHEVWLPYHKNKLGISMHSILWCNWFIMVVSQFKYSVYSFRTADILVFHLQRQLLQNRESSYVKN